MKRHLRLSHDSEDESPSGLIRAAREDVERATGVAMIDQTWRLVLDAGREAAVSSLMRHPVREILSVTVFGREGEASLINPDSLSGRYAVAPGAPSFRRRPEPLRAMNGIEIDFSAGFGEAGTDVPDLLKRAILLLVAHWYEFRPTFGAARPAGFLSGRI